MAVEVTSRRRIVGVLLSLLALLAAPGRAEPLRVGGQVRPPAGVRPEAIAIELVPMFEGAPGTAPLAATRPHPDGFYELTAPGAGFYQIAFRTAGCPVFQLSLSPLVEESELGPLDLSCSPATGPHDAARPAGGKVVPRPPIAVNGRVVRAPGGQPVAGALVWNGERPLSPPARTDGEGRFQLLVAADEPRELSAAARGFLPLYRQSLQRPAGPTTLRLRPAAHLAGVVVDARGGPVAGASLSVGMGGTTWSRPDGRFRLSGLRPQGNYELAVKKVGFPEMAAAVRTAAAGREPAALRIALGEGWQAVGRVVDGAGRPVVGAELTLTRENEDQLWEEEPAASATSDAGGAFVLRRLPGGRFVLHAARRGFAPVRRPGIEIGAGTARVDLGVVTLEPGLAIEGMVTDHRGSPVAGAKVRLDLPAHSTWAETKIAEDPALSRLATSAADGSFRLADLPRGLQLDLRVDHPDYVPARVEEVKVPTPEPLQIELKPGRSLSGRVVNLRGEPVPGARVVQIEQDEHLGSRVAGLKQTDARGAFRLVRLAPGTVRLEVSADGYRARRTAGIAVPEDRDVEGLEVTLDPGASLSGRVLDSRGQSVAGALVGAANEERPPGGAFLDAPGPVKTDAAGRWSIGGLAPGPARVQAGSPRGRVEAEARLQLEPGENHLDLTLPARAEVAGRVSDEAEAPLPGAELRLTATGTGEIYRTQSEADGTFVIPDVPDGDFVLQASRHGFAAATYPGGVRVAGQPVGGVDLHLTRLRPSAIIGRLLGLEPDELVGAQVSAWCGSGQRLPGSVGPDGRYRVAGIDPGDCQVEATSASGNSAEGSVHVDPDAVLDLEFQHGFTLSGHVLVDGRPLVDALVLVLAPAGSPPPTPAEGQAHTAYDGSFAVAHVKPGVHRLEVAGMNGFEYGLALDVTADRTVEIQVTTGGVHGRVLAAGAPLAGARVLLAGSDPVLGPVSGPGATTDDQGRFDLPRVVSGGYQMTVRKAGFAPVVTPLEVRPGESAAVDVTLQTE